MITVTQMREGQATHREFYAQFAEAVIPLESRTFSGEELRAWDDKSKHIELRDWDKMIGYMSPKVRQMADETGLMFTTSTAVCILKEAGKQIVEEWR